MRKSWLLLSTGMWAVAVPAVAQTAPAPDAPSATEQAGAVGQGAAAQSGDVGDIIVTATRRNQALSDVPLAVSAVTAASLQNSGASDLRQLAQLSPSLLVSSSSSEAGGGVARIRGIGTVGDNPGLESSVAVFVDGVYRSRSATALTELGAIDRIEVLRGPQGTLFGRNASAGLISIITAKPRFDFGAEAEASYGNYDYKRGVLGVTGPIDAAKTIAFRLDGVYLKRDGFIRETTGYVGAGDRRFQDRDRWLVRGQLLFQPTDAFSFRLIGDYAKRNEQCCTGPYISTGLVLPGPNGTILRVANPVVAAIRSIGGVVDTDTYARRVSVSPARDYRQDVRDWGVSGEANYEFGGATLTSISAYRDNDYVRGQDADFNNLDILYRPNDGTDFIRFRTFSQELRLQGKLFDDKLDWLVGGYYADEKLDVRSRLTYGADFDRYVDALVRTSSPTFPGFGALQTAFRGGLQLAGASAAVAAAAVPFALGGAANTGIDDRYRQRSRNYAFFTHNVFEVTSTLSVTLGARYTHERKRLDASFASNVPNIFSPFAVTATSPVAALTGDIVGLRTLAANPTQSALVRGTATSLANQLTTLATSPGPLFGVLSSYNGALQSRRSEGEWSGTAVVSWKPVPSVLTYASYSKGYKAGGFNLDRSVLNLAAPTGADLQFAPEKVDAYEAGVKWNGPGVDINIAGFWQEFKNFQLNNFQGLNFIVANIEGCSELAGGSGADSDVNAATGQCTGKIGPGVRSRGVEIEAFLHPARDLAVNLGFTLADTRYRNDLSTTPNALNPIGSLPTSLFQLPGRKLSNAPEYVVTGSTAWTPPIGDGGMHGLLYVDYRYQSEVNTGSDLNLEKEQNGTIVVNARIGLRGPRDRWGIELWAQNLLDVDYKQIAFNTPLQGSGETRAVQAGLQTSASRLYSSFLSEPRTFGVTVRGKF